jgi:hypothetical protein
MAEVAGEVKLLLTVDGTTWSAALDRAQRELDKLKGKTTEASRVTRAEMTEARHAIHLLGEEIGIGLPRALQGFVAKLPGVAEAMAGAFSAVAVVGLGMVLVETGKKVYEFIEKTKKAAEEATRATEQFTASREQANLEMEVSNAKLEEEIAKLEKKPGDGLKTALAEARLEAFKLGRQLEQDVEEMHKLIETKLAAGLMERIGGMAGSADTLQQLDEYGEKIKEIAAITDPAKRTEEMRSYTGKQLDWLHEEIEARTELQRLEEKERNYIPGRGNALTDEERLQLENRRARFTGGEAGVDQSKALRALGAFHDMVQLEYNKADLAREQMEDQRKRGELQGIADREKLAKDAIEALKRQTAERMAAMEQELANEKMVHQMTLEEERAFWQKRYMIGSQLADPINSLIARRIAPLTQEIFKQDKEQAKEWLAMMSELQKEADRLAGQNNPFMRDRAEARNESETEAARMAALHERPELQRQIAAAQDELNASEAVTLGLMTSQTAEIMKQSNVVARLQDELAELYGKQAAVAAMPASLYTPSMNPEAIENQILQKQAELGAAKQVLQYETERDTFGEQMRQMFQDWITRATELHATMSDMFRSSLDTVNNAILKTMTDPYHRGDWKAAGKSIATGIAGKGLTAAEGYLMKAARLGTRENPMYTRSADKILGADGQRAMDSLLGSAASSTASTAGGSAVGKILGALVTSIPFMASGGTLDAGMPAIVGERGPELFVPSGSGRIVPNDRFGGASHTWNIDARGAGDPVAVRYQVQRGILEAAPKIAAGAIAAARDLDSRKPLMSR